MRRRSCRPELIFRKRPPPGRSGKTGPQPWGRCAFFPALKTCPGNRDRREAPICGQGAGLSAAPDKTTRDRTDGLGISKFKIDKTACLKLRLDSLSEHPWQLQHLIENDLESVTVPRFPVIAELKRWLIRQGALAASMSGSGPTVFGIFRTAQAAEDAEIIARKNWPDCWVHTAEVIGHQN